MAWSEQAKPNGSAALSVKQPLSPFWDARVGADMTVVNQPSTLTNADLLRQKFATDAQPSQSTGTAWAAVTAPGLGTIWDKTAIEARVDPAQDRSKLDTSLSKSLPLSDTALRLFCAKIAAEKRSDITAASRIFSMGASFVLRLTSLSLKKARSYIGPNGVIVPMVFCVVLPRAMLFPADSNTPAFCTNPSELRVTVLFDARTVPFVPTPIP